MIRSGDELSKTQHGNNNPYCQDTPLSWLDWTLDAPEEQSFLAFVKRVIQLRRTQPVLQRRRFFMGEPLHGKGSADIVWLSPSGSSMEPEEWRDPNLHAIGALMDGMAIGELGENGEYVIGNTLLLLLNAQETDIPFRLPCHRSHGTWHPLLDTTQDEGIPLEKAWEGDNLYCLPGRSLVLFQLH